MTLRQELPEFDPDGLLGGSIDAFHKHPEHQAGLLASLTSTHTAEVNIGPRTMRDRRQSGRRRRRQASGDRGGMDGSHRRGGSGAGD